MEDVAFQQMVIKLIVLGILGIGATVIFYKYLRNKEGGSETPLKKAAAIQDEYSFIENPNVVNIKIEIDQIDGIGLQDSLEDQADIIWKYTDMKTEVYKQKESEEMKGAEDIVEAMFNSETSVTTRTEIVENQADEDMETKKVFVPPINVGPDNEVMVEPFSPDHNEVEDYENEGIENNVDLDDLAEDQEL